MAINTLLTTRSKSEPLKADRFCAATRPQGVYFLSDDGHVDDAIAFLNSLRRYEPDLPVFLIPYRNHGYHQLWERIARPYHVALFNEPLLFDWLERGGAAVTRRPAPMFRKLAAWFGPLERFVYYDTDMVLFTGLHDVFDLLNRYDFVYYNEGRTIGLREVFTPAILEQGILSPPQVNEIFNAGFFASRRGVIGKAQIDALFAEAQLIADDCFEQTQQDQPFLNFLALRARLSKLDLRNLTPTIPEDAWAGGPDLRIKEDKAYKLYNGEERPVRHVHWAGYKPRFPDIRSRPHLSLWLRYRYPGRSGWVRRAFSPQIWAIRWFFYRLFGMGNPRWYRLEVQIKRLHNLLRHIPSLFRLQGGV